MSDRPLEKMAKFIPLRLDEDERKLLKVLENALEVCEYTDTVDVTFSHLKKSKASRMWTSLIDILNINSGLLISTNLTQGEAMFAGKTHDDNIVLYRNMFEIGRRYKMMNPNKMKDTYGKLIYMLMDTRNSSQFAEYNFVGKIRTVGNHLNGTGLEGILTDPNIVVATECISSGGDKETVARKYARKSAAAQEIIKRYAEGDQSREVVVQRCIDSISDYQAFLRFNVGPVEQALGYLTQYFKENAATHELSDLTLRPVSTGRSMFSSSYGSSYGGYSFSGNSLSYRNRGACLSHNHATQYQFVLQSLTLWKEIMNRLPMMWFAADHDMVEQSYRLADTGQGYQRLQQCPNVSAQMRDVLNKVHGMFSNWVGLSVVHLGDRDVPNALMFIDKYTQIPRILGVLNSCIEALPSLTTEPALDSYIQEEWGGVDGLRYQILSDYFKHGFDGSGDDGGSCIDGRLTSTWNWCSELSKKPYHGIFLFSGFQGFDAFENQQE